MRNVLEEIMEERRVVVDEVSSPSIGLSFVIVTQNRSNKGVGFRCGKPKGIISYED